MNRNRSERLAALYTYLADPHITTWGRPLDPPRRSGQQIQQDLRRLYPSGAAGKRALYRDIDALRLSGVAVESDHRVDGRRTFAIRTTNRPPLDPLALAALTDIDDRSGQLTTILAKLGGRVRRPAGVPAAVPAGVDAGIDPVDDLIAQLDEALHQQRLVSFSYDGRFYPDVEPAGLVRSDGRTYLTAMVGRSRRRRFRTDRIDGPITIGAAFTPPAAIPDAPPPPWQFGPAAATSIALISFDATVARAAAARFGAVKAFSSPDATVTLAVSYSDADRLVRTVLEFADRAEILHPQPLRDQIVAHLQGCRLTSGASR